MNYATDFSNSGTPTQFTVADMGAPIVLLDKTATYSKWMDITLIPPGTGITWDGVNKLTWDADIHLSFIRADGDLEYNVISAGSSPTMVTYKTLYVDLVETTATPVTPTVATMGVGSAANPVPFNRVTLGRTDGSGRFYPQPLIASLMLAQGRILQTQAFSATPTFDWSLGKTARIVQTANVTASTFTKMKDAELYYLEIEQNATPGWTWVWDANIKWAGATAPTVSAGASNIDVFEFISINSVIHGRIFSQVSS